MLRRTQVGRFVMAYGHQGLPRECLLVLGNGTMSIQFSSLLAVLPVCSPGWRALLRLGVDGSQNEVCVVTRAPELESPVRVPGALHIFYLESANNSVQ